MRQILIALALALSILPFLAKSQNLEEVTVTALNQTVDKHLDNRLAALRYVTEQVFVAEVP